MPPAMVGCSVFHAPIEHFRKAGKLRHFLDGKTRLTKQARRPARRDQLHAAAGQLARELDESPFCR